MTFNALGFNAKGNGVVTSIRRSGADIVALQELNPEIAAAIEEELLDEYPYQILEPKTGVIGMGSLTITP